MSRLQVFFSPFERLSGGVARVLIAQRWIFFGLALALIAFGAFGLSRVESSTNSRAFFGASNPEFQQLLEVEDIYESSEPSVMVLSTPAAEPYDPTAIEALRRFTEQAWQLPYVLRVDSLTNFNYSYADGDDLLVEPLVPETGAITRELADLVRVRVEDTGELIGRLVSEDGRTFGISVSFVPPDRDVVTYRGIQDEIDALVAQMRTDFPDYELFVAGAIPASLAFSEAGERDLREILPLAGALTILILMLGLGSVAGVIGSVIVLVGSSTFTLGFGGWMGMALTPGNSSSPLAVFVLIATTCMHIVLMWRHALSDGAEPKAALRTSLEDNFAPVTVTNLTTAFAFLCLNFSDAPPLRDLGNMIAAGIVGGWFLSLTIMPAVLLSLPAPRPRRSQPVATTLKAAVAVAFRNERVVIACFGIAVITAIVGITRIQFNDDFIRYFDKSYEIRRDSEEIEARLTSLDVLQFSFESELEGGIFAPEFLNQIEDFATWLEDHPQVRHVTSITVPLKRLNRIVNRDDPAYMRIADTTEANAQLMLLYELNLPVGQNLNTQISIDRDQTLVSITLDIQNAVELRAFTREAEDWLRREAPEIATQATGVGITFARISQRNGRAMLLGTVVVLVVISAAMVLILRSARLGAISLVPNLLPALLAFGVWGLVLRDVNLGSTVVTVMTFGIVVDDTVHMMMAYNRYRSRGFDPRQAVNRMLENVGPAITITTLTICTGFTVVAMSSFALNQHLGALTALVVGMAFIADLLLLPILLTRSERTSQ